MALFESSRPLEVLIVAQERKMLRHVSRFLSTFGYRVSQARHAEQALGVLAISPIDLLILDADPDPRQAIELRRRFSTIENARCTHTLLLVDLQSQPDLTEALEAGVDDFLAKPLVHGEMLTRLRAGARALEFERRARDQLAGQSQTGLPGAAAFHDHLRREFAVPGRKRQPACLLLDIDFLEHVNHVHGYSSGDIVLKAIADQLRAACCDAERALALPAALGGNRFGVLLPEKSLGEAADWAEQLRQTMADTEIPLDEQSEKIVRVTVSFGLAANDDTVSEARQLLQRADQALCLAKTSGRDCVVSFGQFDEDDKEWENLAAPGKLFEHTTARDVMTPCPMLLREDDTLRHAGWLLRQTRCDALPVVDAEGCLAGFLSADEASEWSGRGEAETHLAELMTTEVPTCEEAADFATLMGILAEGTSPQVVIVSDGRPTGLVTPAALALLSEPLTKDTFASGTPSTSSDYLMVAEAK